MYIFSYRMKLKFIFSKKREEITANTTAKQKNNYKNMTLKKFTFLSAAKIFQTVH